MNDETMTNDEDHSSVPFFMYVEVPRFEDRKKPELLAAFELLDYLFAYTRVFPIPSSE
jgi:hypothetical protein